MKRTSWFALGTLTTLLVVTLGCQHSRPDVKPPPRPEVLNPAPQDSRANTNSLPKTLMSAEDSMKHTLNGWGTPIQVPSPRGGRTLGASGP